MTGHDTIKGTDVLDWLEYSFTFLDFCSKAGAQEMPKTCGLLLSNTVFELHAKFEANRSENSRDRAIVHFSTARCRPCRPKEARSFFMHVLPLAVQKPLA